MKRTTTKIIIVLILSMTIHAKQVTKLTKTNDGYLFNYKVPALSVNEVDRYGLASGSQNAAEVFSDVSISNYWETEDIGKAKLPRFQFYMALSDLNQTPAFEVLNPVTENIPLQNRVMPAQVPWPKSRSIYERPFSLNEEYYNSEGEINPVATVAETFTIRGVPCARIVIDPFSYNPVENKLTVIKEFTLKINTSTTVNTVNLDSKVFERYLRYVLVNFDQAVEVKGDANRNEDYHIITAPDFESGLSDFVDFRKKRFNVTMVTTDETGTSSSNIKSYIQGLNPTPAFLLLVGDVGDIPEAGSSPTTDLGYSSTDGDYHPEIFLGRFSVASSSDLSNIVRKTMFMETNLRDIEKKNVFIGGADAGSWDIAEETHDYVINNYLDDAGYDNLKLYCNSSSVSESQFTSAINDGVIFNVYSGHGGTSSWGAGDFSFSGSDAQNLDNTTSYPFSYGFACLTGGYESGECFTEGATRAENGFVICVGSSVTSSWGPDDRVERGIFDAIFDDNNPQTSVAASLNAGKLNNGSQGYYEQYNLMGDPGLEVFPVNTSPYVMVSKPNGGEEIEQGTSYLIKWSSNVSGNAKIDLYKAGVLSKTIANTTPNTGSYEWAITSDYAVGNDYKVKISSIENDTCIDESNENFNIVEERIFTIPYYQDFNNWSRSTTDYWEQGDDDDLDWTILSGPTPSRDGGYTTGPEGDFPNGSGQYIYIEASDPNYPSKKAFIVTPKFDFQSVVEAKLRLYYHMYSGEQVMGDFFVDVQVGSNSAWEEAKISLTGNDYGDNWIEEQLDLNFIISGSYTAEQKKRVRFRLRGITSDDSDEGWSSDICVDSFSIDNVSTSIITSSENLTCFDMQYKNSRICYHVPDFNKNIGVTIKLYNIQGKQIRTLVNEEKKPGFSYYVELGTNTQRLAAGVYLCKMNAGSFSKTIKFIKK